MDNSKTIITLLEKYNIEYWTEGKNVSPGSTNVQCPFCDDHSNHCGIFHDDLGYHCWRCDASGSFDYLLARLTGQDVARLKEEIADLGFSFEVDSSTQIEELWRGGESQLESPVQQDGPPTLPKYFDPVTPQMDFPLLDWYLNLRGYTRDILIRRECGICSVGVCMNRLVIPIKFDHQLVSWQAADLTRRAQLKYKTSPGEVNNYLYQWDLLDQSIPHVVIVEGVLDAWRFDDGFNVLATFGTHMTDRQKNLLIRLRPSRVIVSWDGDAIDRSIRLAEDLRTFLPRVDVAEFPLCEDPDSFGKHFGVEVLKDLVISAKEL